MPDCSGEPVVTTSCAFLFLHARPRVQRAPGIPCALSIRAVDVKLGRIAPRERGGVCLDCCLKCLVTGARRRSVASRGRSSGVRHGRARRRSFASRRRTGHPRALVRRARTWMPGTRPGMTSSEGGFGQLRSCRSASYVASMCPSWPGLSRPSTSFLAGPRTWMPGTRPGMTSGEVGRSITELLLLVLYVASMRPSWPGLSRPSTSFVAGPRTWMPGTRPGMTVLRIGASRGVSAIIRLRQTQDVAQGSVTAQERCKSCVCQPSRVQRSDPACFASRWIASLRSQ